MAINMMCMNSKCKNYYEDNCMNNINEKRIEINGDGRCETFEEGTNELYNCEFSKDGRCYHSGSKGELLCNGTDLDKDGCMEFN